MPIKLILLALGAWIAYRFIKSRSRATRREDVQTHGTGEDMVRCVHCGVHLPRSESIISHDEFFCTNEHRQRHRK